MGDFVSSAIKINIRQATLADGPTIARFNAQLAQETENRALDLQRVLRGVEALLNDPAKGTYFVAEVEGAPVGQLLLTYEWSDWRNGNFWWIQSVYVSQEFRASGIFTALYGNVHDLAQRRDGVCGLRLYVEGDNTRAQKTYERLGMTRTDYQMFEIDFVLLGKPT